MRLPCKSKRTKDEGGFVLVLISLMIMTLFLVAGFAVDLGSWYLNASKIQRAADAAALSGASDMPNVSAAINDAVNSARRNGYVDGENGVTVTIAPSGAGGRLNVQIKDSKVPAYFTSLVRSNVVIGRGSTAEQLSPAVMGTPFNVLGSGTVDWGELEDMPAQNFWLAINGACTPKEDGDQLASRWDGNRNFKPDDTPTNTRCTNTGTETNPEYRSTGYDYNVTIPANTPGNVIIQVFDPNFQPTDLDWYGGNPQGHSMSTRFAVYDSLNDQNPGNDVLLASKTYGYITHAASGGYNWFRLAKIHGNSTGVPHVYRVAVSTDPSSDSGENSFSIMAVRDTGPRAGEWCDGRPGAVHYDANCPQVAGDGYMSVMADSMNDDGMTTLFLGRVDPQYAGAMIQVSLWDPGEGFKNIRLISPDGRVVPVRWTSSPSLESQQGPAYAVDVSGDGVQPGTNQRLGTSKYNDRLLSLTTRIPDNYQTYIDRANGSTWWSVQYEADPDSWLHDRSTWSMSLGGTDPVHLTDAN